MNGKREHDTAGGNTHFESYSYPLTDNLYPIRLLLVNSERLFSLRAGIGPAGDGYRLEHVPVMSMPKGAELISCNIVPTRRSRAQSTTQQSIQTTLGMVCLAMISPASDPTTTNRSTKQGDAAGGPTVRSTTPNGNIPASGPQPPVVGLLYVYPMRGERKFEVKGALQQKPQQLVLPFIPAGMTHATVWRGATPPNYVELASSTSRFNYHRVEQGDALLLWDRNGDWYGYTRWAGFPTDGKGNFGDGFGVTLASESRESLTRLVPELESVSSPILNLSTLAMDEGDAGRRRQIVAGCVDGVYHAFYDATNCRKDTTFTLLNGPVPAVGFISWPLRNVRDRFTAAAAATEVIGFACGELGMMASLVKSGCDESRKLLWATANGTCVDCTDEVTCISCADFFRDGSNAVAVGTRDGRVMIYESSSPSNVFENSEVTDMPNYDAGFGATCWDDDDSTSEECHHDLGETPHSSERHHHYSSSSDRPLTENNAPATIPGLSLPAKWEREVSHPVWGIALGDFNHDGVDEMIVATQFGLHVFRPDYRDEGNRLAKTLDALQTLQPNRTVPSADDSDDGVENAVSLLGVEVHEVAVADGLIKE